MAATKQFKLGEYCIGGIIKVDIIGKIILIKALDWNSKKEVMTGSYQTDIHDAHAVVDNFLNELTTYYYADKIMTWIKSKTKLS